MPTAESAKTEARQSYAFARHETFHLRDGWLLKGLEALSDDGLALYGKEAHHNLGVGKNMLRAIIYWLQATRLVEPDPSRKGPRSPLILTPLADLVRDRDPYLEDTGTLWVLHIELASNLDLATFWYWAFSELPQREFTEERLVQGIQGYLEDREASTVAESSLQKDARCFIRTYVPSRGQSAKLPVDEALDCPLTLLGLIRETPIPGQYKFQVGGHRGLPALLFACSLYKFKEHFSPGESIVSLEDLRWAPMSPGRLLCLDTRAILDYLEELENLTSYAQVIRTAGLNMVSLDRAVGSIDLLREYYTQRDTHAKAAS